MIIKFYTQLLLFTFRTNFLGSLLSAGASLIGGALANKGKQKSADKASKTSAIEAQKSRDFSERLSNTAHQRETADLESAGLNRILSAQTQGASTPTAAQGQGFSADYQDIITPAVQTGFSAYQANATVDKQVAETGLTQVQQTKVTQEIENLKSQKNLTDVNTQVAVEQIGKLVNEIQKLAEEKLQIQWENISNQQKQTFLQDNPTLNKIKAVSETVGIDANDILGLLTSVLGIGVAGKIFGGKSKGLKTKVPGKILKSLR